MNLQVIGKLHVPQSAKDHRFVLECLAAARTMEEGPGVLGTEDSGRPELFGWQPNVKPHVDMTGFVYFMPIISNGGFVCVSEFEGEEEICLPIQCGTVYRLDDRECHWTRDDSITVGLFLGSYDEPNDAGAMALLSAGLSALCDGLYYETPRVGFDFRVVMHDECLVQIGKSYEYQLISDAEKNSQSIVHCSQCGCSKHAVVVSRYFPSFPHENRCAEHISTEKFLNF